MIALSDDPARLDVARVHGWLAGSYWSPGIEWSRIERAIAGSHGVYEKLGFHPLLRPDRWMERLSPAAEALLRAAS